MAQKRIRMVRQDMLGDKLRLLYDDGTQGFCVMERPFPVLKSRFPFNPRASSALPLNKRS